VRFTSAADIAAFLPAGRQVIGIVGAPGAGKSTIAASLVTALDDAALLPMDGYHLPQSRLVELGRRDRMGAPDTFDVDGFVADLTAVRAGLSTVHARGFDREIEEPVPGSVVIPAAAQTVIVEGNYLLLDSFGWDRVAPLLDATFFIELDPGIRQQRLIDRHVLFGKSRADATEWAMGPDESNALMIAETAPRATHTIALQDEAPLG
jgi:pantothenate kinase